MKRILAGLSILFVVLLAACGGGDTKEEDVEVTVGASSTPHAEILEEAKPLLEAEGITLTIESYEDFILPNEDLENERLDANYFQHTPYLEQQIEDIGYDFVSIGNIHIEPMGLYSKNIPSIEAVEEGTEIIMSRSIADHGRILALVEAAGLITLDEGVDKAAATVEDVTDNPRNLTFSADVDPAFLPELYDKEADALVAINTNYAIGAKLNPLEDALFIEGEESPYPNILVVRTEDEDNEALVKLVEILQSEEIQDFILEKFEGAVVPLDGK